MDALIPAAHAQAAGAAPGGQLAPLLMMVLFIVIFYFLLIRPQQKKAKEHQAMLGKLAAGDEVVTAGGIYGEITNKKDDRFVVRIADGVKIEVGKAFITTVLKKTSDDKK